MLESGLMVAVVAAAVWWQLESWLVAVTVVVVSWWYSRRRHSYWTSMGVITPSSLPFIGHMHKFISLTTSRWGAMHEMYKKYGHSRCFGLYEGFHPVLVICDPDLLRSVMIKDFDHFMDRRTMGEQPGSLLSEMLSNKKGEAWKVLRNIMSPTFSSGKMRQMFPLICEKAHVLVSSCLQDVTKYSSIEMKDKCGRFSMDTIASCAFGIECNSLTKEKPLFAQHAEHFFSPSPLKTIRMVFMVFLPKIFNAVGLKADNVDIEFFRSVVEETIRSRQGGQPRGDLLDLLMEARAGDDDTAATAKHVLKDRDVVAQCILFLIAGYDTTASTLSLCSYLLAKNLKEQQRLRQELQQLAKEEGELTYQGVMEAKLLDACVNETLRIFPPGFLGERVCTKSYRVPGTEATVRPGDLLQFPIYSLHHDPRYWTDPLQFRPDRFLPENKANIKSFTYLPFGMGPRNCIATRLALMEVKVGLAKLIMAADLQVAPGHEEIVLSKSFIVLRPEYVHLLLTPRAVE